MSVTGEFGRYAKVLVDLLDTVAAPWATSASKELQNATGGEAALARQAERTLEILASLPSAIDQGGLDPDREREVREGCEDLASIGRVVLGR
jgi:hypothetical protein